MQRSPRAQLARLTRSAPLVAGLTALGLAPGATPAHAQRNAAVLLELPASPRAAAMGDAGGLLGDVGSMPYNAAVVARMHRPEVGLSVERYLGGSTLGSATAAMPIGRVVLGATVLTLRYPDAAEVLEAPDGGEGIETGARVRGHDAVAGLSVALGWDGLHIGGGAKWVSQSLPGASGGTLAADLGAVVGIGRLLGGTLALAAAAQHLGGPVELAGSSAALPRTLRAGVVFVPRRLAGATWTVALETTSVRDERLRLRQGVEAVWMAFDTAIAARLGTMSRQGADRQEPLTVGGGVTRGDLALDYAWRRFGALGSTHRFGMRWRP